MPTRFYLPASGSPPVTPVLGSGWEQTTGWAAHPTGVTKTNTALANGTARTKDSTTANIDRLDRVYVSTQQLAAQTITGTFSMVQRGFESATANNAWLQVIIRVVSADGATERGVLYAGSTATTQVTTVGAENQEFQVSGGAATKIKNAIAVSSVSAQAGDRLTIEIGYRANNTASTGSCTLRYGDPTGTADYALTADLTTDLCPWVELSQSLTWQSSGVTGTGAGTATAVTASGAGTVTLTGAGAGTATAFTASGAGTIIGPVTGTGAAAATAFTAVGAGTVHVTGTGAATAAAATASGTGTLRLTGTGAASVAPLEASAAGTLTATGIGSATVSAFTASGAGTLRVAGTGAATAAPVEASGSGTVTEADGISGSGAAAVAAFTASGSGTLRLTGTGAASATPFAASGVGMLSVVGAGALTAQAVQASAAGLVALTGSGAATTPVFLASGGGSVSDPAAPRDITLHVGAPTTRGLAAALTARTATPARMGTRNISGRLAARSLDGDLLTRITTGTLEEKVEFSRVDKKYVKIPVTATLAEGGAATIAAVDVALLALRSRPTATTTWASSSYAAGVATVLVAGPDADPAGALVLPAAGADVWIRVTDTPEVDAEKVGRISVS